MFEEILDRLVRARDRGDVEILTMGEVAARMERGRERELPDLETALKGHLYDSQKQHSHS
jgi:hypothetical protein